MKFLITNLILLILFSSFHQTLKQTDRISHTAEVDTVNQLTLNGLKEGYWIEKDNNGILKQGHYVGNVKQGEWVETNDKVWRIICTYKNDSLIDSKFYRMNSIKCLEHKFISKTRDTITCIDYFDTLKDIIQYKTVITNFMGICDSNALSKEFLSNLKPCFTGSNIKTEYYRTSKIKNIEDYRTNDNDRLYYFSGFDEMGRKQIDYHLNFKSKDRITFVYYENGNLKSNMQEEFSKNKASLLTYNKLGNKIKEINYKGALPLSSPKIEGVFFQVFCGGDCVTNGYTYYENERNNSISDSSKLKDYMTPYSMNYEYYQNGSIRSILIKKLRTTIVNDQFDKNGKKIDGGIK